MVSSLCGEVSSLRDEVDDYELCFHHDETRFDGYVLCYHHDMLKSSFDVPCLHFMW